MSKRESGFIITGNVSVGRGIKGEKGDKGDTPDITPFKEEYESLKKIIIDENSSANLQNQINTVNSHLDSKASKIELAKESARIDAFTSLPENSTTGDAELIDGRVCNNALTYKNIGSAIREQIEIVDSQINNYTTLLDYKKLDNLQVGFIGLDGVLNTSSSSHKVIKISAKNIKSFRVIKGTNELTSGLCYGVFKKSDGTVNRIITYDIDSAERELTDEDRKCDIYLNWFNFSQNLYCSSIEITYISVDDRVQTAIDNALTYKNIGSAIRSQIEMLDSQINNYTTLLDYKKLDNLQVGFIGLDGVLNTSTSFHKVLKISAKNIKSFRIIKGTSELTSGLCYGVFKKSDGSVNRIIPYNVDSIEKELTDENRQCDIYLNWFNFNQNLYSSSIEIKYISVDEKITTATNNIINNFPIEPIKYNHCLYRPFTFNGKSIDFYGDSITEGFTSSSTTTPNGYPKLFADSVGATFRNKGVGGSCLCMPYNTLDSIITKITQNLTNADYCFIAGGVNDWQCGATKQQLTDGMTNLCNWLKSNYNGTVIFITPINFSNRQPIVTPQMTLWEVRQIITEIALSNGYNVIQGYMFPFPTEIGNYATTLFGDGLHPTEKGYKIYSQSLKTILC